MEIEEIIEARHETVNNNRYFYSLEYLLYSLIDYNELQSHNEFNNIIMSI